MMGDIARDLYLAKILVLVCRVVPEAYGIKLRPMQKRVIWDGTTTVERWSCTLRWLFAETCGCTTCNAQLHSFVG